MTIADALLGFAVVATLITIIPGLDTTLVLRSSLIAGGRYAAATAVGIGTGALAWGAAAAVGAAALLATSQVAYRIVTLAGVAYMVYLGVSMLVRSFRRRGPDAASVEAPVARSPWRAFLLGLTTNLLNPKVGVFYIATIPQFLPEGASALGMGLLLALVHDLISLVWFALIIVGAGFARRWLTSDRAMRIIDRVTGGILIVFGVRLALDQRL